MATFVELHLIQNFAPSCLNRDDTGAPKDAMFGGFRRSRISSQCIKRAIRETFSNAGLLKPEELGIRTRNLVAILEQKLADQGITDATSAIENALATVELKVKARTEKSGHTEYLLFLSNNAINELAGVIASHLDALQAGKGDREVKKAIDACIGSASAVDVALFGRMLADRKELNVDAAAQVAHAISTHRVDRESDFFTAVDDWTKDKNDEEADAGMLGTVEFNSSCQYRYAVVNLDKLIENLDGDAELAQRGLQAFLRASVLAIPTGRQNTFAAHNLPSFVGIAVHNSQPISLANAFEKPVWAGEHKSGLAAASVARLQSHATQLSQAFGLDLGLQVLDLTGTWQGEQAKDLEALLTQVDAALQSGR
ncbi:type I-E CRISPR-associated protein Cas7/Cse4/CasC [Vulcanococcus limneticus Candia 3F8]|uniref:type I-E CRISPR-associated protein Cas7/Cse4/CasC n=1 Tax=Vulcanococcus limneticus TaxID=2170428 RepID=UPI0020CEB48A|nr:type I-E CRISPR-associated protein Cas7/Cse4/CasC [Vulcanococcus limneticus]MCP9793387.1 type I-E CRISPR-associated protein Cas7/Cse4/CasC [Vulcanococcus limneticus MW73D5]MCP9895535.1 type I-E CRISPR-associated protein Cas7/Cse4/CasC [Vulcanococcus limneticus Candia 3F8]MCP9898788.1 type I-E CRISPR-associated protein Cas7/Cse4/CasC [Vulcanococcus limneticus Candia 3B3]